jgi:hypothetical protein
MRRPTALTASLAAAFLVVGAGMVIHAAVDPTSGLAGHRFEGIR